MDANEIKACLKKARDDIREKDFKEALKQSKAVLTADKDNYNALVFIGLAAEGMNQPEQALKAFRKASEKEPDQLLAWQGLASFRDKNPNLIQTDEAITIYQKLAALTTSDTKKHITFSSKLVDLYLKSQKKNQAIEILQHILELQKEQPDRTESLKLLITLLSDSPLNLSQSKLNLYQSALSEILQCTSWLNKDDINMFIELQLNITAQMDADTLKTSCETFNETFPDAPSPKEFLLRSQLEANIGNATVSIATCEQVKSLVDQLHMTRPDSTMIPVAQSFLAVQKKYFVQALSLLQNCSSDNLSGLYFLTLTNLGLHKYSQCLEAAKKGLVALSSPGRVKCTSTANVGCWFKLAMAEAYREMNTTDTRENALSILEEVFEKLPTESLLIKAYVHLDQGNITEAENCANQLPQDFLPVQTLKATVLHAKKEYTSALQILRKVIQEDPSDFKATFKLGQTLWELRESQTIENIKQDCFNLLLKAAKLDSLHYASFLYLGYFYREIQQDNVKARKCFQKSYDLNPTSAEAGSALVDLLMEQGELSQCSVILHQATSQAAAGHAKWAWLRQGLYQLKQNDFTAATKSLQSALRGDPNDNHVWECLADAYLERGSHNAALKAFTKASELDPNSVYCLYKIANIKHILGELTEAVQEYKKILEKSPDYVPVLKGVAESLILLGKTNLDNCLDELAKGCFQEAILYLTRAAAQRPDLSCLWKLLGEACTFIYPTAIESFNVPVKLFKKTSNVHELKEISKIELLQVGASCYSQALRIFSESSSLWHDLGVNLYQQSQVTLSNKVDTASGLMLLDRATKAVKRAVDLEPNAWQHWNLLGVIASCNACEKPALAQHCFIKSIECEANNAMAWTNLGAFYLSKSNIELAFNAFTNAQNIDPTYLACWIGQAMIAETVGHQEAMDLFRHSSELGFHLESSLGYGQWVLKVLGDPAERKTALYHYSIQQMAALPAASDALMRYTRRIKTDPVAYNMQGLLFEHQNLLDSSVLAFQKALSLLEKEDSGNVLNDVRINLARVLSKQGKLDQSLAVYEQCSLSTDVPNTCQYGLTLFKSGRTQDAFKVYKEVLSLVSGQPQESEVYAALGMVSYKAGDTSQAKSLLFKGFQTSQPSVHGLLALCALGLLHKDRKLSTAVLEELFKREDKDEVLKDIHLLKLYQTFLEDHVEEGLTELKQLYETSKENSSLWCLMGECFLNLWPNLNNPELIDSILQLLCLSHGGTTKDKNGHLVQTLCQLLAGFHHRLHSDKNVLKTAQKAFHANPGCLSTLSALTAAVHAEAVVTFDFKSKYLLKVVKDLINILLQDNEITPELKTWSLQMLIITCIELGDVNTAETYLKTFQQGKPLSSDEEMFHKSVQSYLVRQIVPMAEIYPLQVAIDCELSCGLKDFQTGINFLERLIQQTEAKNSCNTGTIRNLKERKAYLAYCGLKDQPDNVMFKKQFDDAVENLKDSPIVLVMDAFRALDLKDKRKAKYLFATSLDKVHGDREIGYCSSLARQWMLELSRNSNKEQDQKLIQNLMEDAKSAGDRKTLERFKLLAAKK